MLREARSGLWTAADRDPLRITPVHSLGVHLFEAVEGPADTPESLSSQRVATSHRDRENQGHER